MDVRLLLLKVDGLMELSLLGDLLELLVSDTFRVFFSSLRTCTYVPSNTIGVALMEANLWKGSSTSFNLQYMNYFDELANAGDYRACAAWIPTGRENVIRLVITCSIYNDTDLFFP